MSCTAAGTFAGAQHIAWSGMRAGQFRNQVAEVWPSCLRPGEETKLEFPVAVEDAETPIVMGS